MRVPVKSLLVSITVFLLLSGTILFLSFMYLTGQSPGDVMNDLQNAGKLSLFKYGLVEKLSSKETKRLYQDTCTKKCHGKDVIEKKPRTASEWESVIDRMKAPDRAGISDRHAETITHYLQSNYLSNVPTVLPDKTMRFLKKYLWKSDFGESDLFLDVIYVPREHRSLLPYLGVRKTLPDEQTALFIVYINTHQGTVPPWNLAKLVTLHHNNGQTHNAIGWEVLYHDGQSHHNQGTLTFPDVGLDQATEMEINMNLPGLGMRTFQWILPIPPLPKGDSVEH